MRVSVRLHEPFTWCPDGISVLRYPVGVSLMSSDAAHIVCNIRKIGELCDQEQSLASATVEVSQKKTRKSRGKSPTK